MYVYTYIYIYIYIICIYTYICSSTGFAIISTTYASRHNNTSTFAQLHIYLICFKWDFDM